MLVVEVSVASEDFIDAVNQIGEWLAVERVDTPFSIYSGDKVRRQIRMGFARDSEGERFAARFGGHVLPQADLGHRPAVVSDRDSGGDSAKRWQ